ncbi:GGDEF domain-containing protein [Lentzea sp. HUAS12]|uniref:GGDEF domain-containing protein n=1 Tax=Lentzea sp. HUAS12 TaxID=2951806 RepID=UPI00209E9471|nr:GGDEF domain-containing protein [Lentzea sp. HUAS12]USX50149.1 GGDEF domain-containing protein [Lentzea sp. HUAS12]
MLHDPLTGLPGHALLLDRLEQSLIRARTRGTLVTLVLVTGPDDLLRTAKALRQNLRPDFTVARCGDAVLAVLAEHDFGDGSPIAELIRQLAGEGPHVHWVTSDGDAEPEQVLRTARTPPERH